MLQVIVGDVGKNGWRKTGGMFQKRKKGKKDRTNKIKTHDMDFNCHNEGKTYDEGKKMCNE